ncbi:MAG: glycosyl hydrolase 2 galactose-binding domain-containing protein [Acidobacteriaceae bacterium]
MFRKRVITLMLGILLGAVHAYAAVPPGGSSAVLELKQGWQVQSACKVQGDGAAFSQEAYHPQGWYSATVPATVLAVQVAAGVYKDPYYGTNLRSIPGTDYPVGENFSNLEMPADSPYRCGWWYRKTFHVPASEKGKVLWLRFGGINYKADIWLNGQKIADKSDVAGAYRTYEFDVSKVAKAGAENVLAVETFAPTPTDLGINWVDWNPCPPDKDMGLWGAVSLTESGPVTVRSPMATTHFSDDSLKTAELTVVAEVHNATDHAVQGKLEGTVAGIRISQSVELAPKEEKTVSFSPEQFPQLEMKNPQVWWPADVGRHPLETLTLRFVANGSVSDQQTVQFGIREVTSELTPEGYRLFRVNRHPILIRGAGWSQDMLLREDPVKLREEFRLVQNMHLNTIRLEGKMETEDFFHLADVHGILVMAGWCCCDQWEHWNKWTPETLKVATASLRSQILRIRNHPSLLVWLDGSDNPPPANVETAYLSVLQEARWPNPVLSSATATPTTVTGHSGVKMTGPYDYVAPSYWLMDTKHGGAYGFNTETSPGPAIPSPESLAKMMPEKDIWPQGSNFNYHAGGGGFKNIDVFNKAMDATYGTPQNAATYNRIAQAMAFDGERAMFEAYGRNKYQATGVIQWMLNNAWPSVIWHLYDYYLDAGGGFYGTKKACELLHIQYSYNDHSIYVVNSLYKASDALTASAAVYDLHLKKLFSKAVTLDSPSDSSTKALDIPADVFDSGSQVYFVRLELKNSTGEVVSRNFYWLPEKLTEFDWAKTNYSHTPIKVYADMQALHTLPTTHVEAVATVTGSSLHLRISNPTGELAFQIAAEIKNADGKSLIPTLWSDNYIELMPGEVRDLTAELPPVAHGTTGLKVMLSGWNIQTTAIHAVPQKTVAER